jgi:hypothetical protein
MTAPQIESFADFWPYYVGAHRNPRNRALHYLGTSSAVAMFTSGLLTANPWFLLAAPLVGYGPAWIGHFLVEGNKPATFGYARYSLMADFKMLGLALQGKMADEVTRLFGSPAPLRDAPVVEAGGSAREHYLAARPSASSGVHGEK